MEENNSLPQQIETSEQADQVLEAIQKPNEDAIYQDPTATKTESAPPDDYELTVGGKQIKATRDQVLKWASMGYNAPNEIGKLNKEVSSWKQREAELNQLKERYGQVDEYVKQNPRFWDHVMQTYQQKEQLFSDPTDPMATTLRDLQAQVQDLVQYKSQIEQQQAQARMAQEDQELEGEFNKLKETYPAIDFVTPDESGKTLEYKVLEYAAQNGIKKLTTAFRDFYYPELEKMIKSSAKEEAVKEKMKNTKMGILGITPQPTKKVATDHRGKSYDQLAQEIISEFGLT